MNPKVLKFREDEMQRKLRIIQEMKLRLAAARLAEKAANAPAEILNLRKFRYNGAVPAGQASTHRGY